MKKIFFTLVAMLICVCGMSQTLVFHLTDGTTYTTDVNAALSITTSGSKFVIKGDGLTKELPMNQVTNITGTGLAGRVKGDVNGDSSVDVADIGTIIDLIAENTGSITGGDAAPGTTLAIDLGLPSGTMWANMNVGAEKPEDYGLFFAWGETTGYGTDTTDGHQFDWANYKWYAGTYFKFLKYNTSIDFGATDDKTELELDDDAAYVNWGGDWRMPTRNDVQELIDNTTSTLYTLNGVTGVKFTSNINGNSIFLPISGYRQGGNIFHHDSKGYYWTSTLIEDSPKYAYGLFTTSAGTTVFGYERTYGLNVRPVSKPDCGCGEIHPDEPYDHEDGEMPCSDEGDFTATVSANGEALPGGATIVNITSPEEIDKFYIAISGQEGYYIQNAGEPAFDGTNYLYRLVLLLPQEWNSNAQITVNGYTEDGRFFGCQQVTIRYHEAGTGALQVSLTFDNAKDVDLHLFTPSGKHYYWSNRGETFTDSNGNTVFGGLDVDSNPACNIDNINCENITLPEEMVEEGEYRVVVNMFNNCDPLIATGWTCVATYAGDLVTNKLTSYGNPASGVYPVGQSIGDMTEVMRFTVKEASSSRAAERRQYIFKPVPLDATAILKQAQLKALEEQE